MAIESLAGGNNCYSLQIESAHDLHEAIDLLHTLVLDSHSLNDEKLLLALEVAMKTVSESDQYVKEEVE